MTARVAPCLKCGGEPSEPIGRPPWYCPKCGRRVFAGREFKVYGLGGLWEGWASSEGEAIHRAKEAGVAPASWVRADLPAVPSP